MLLDVLLIIFVVCAVDFLSLCYWMLLNVLLIILLCGTEFVVDYLAHSVTRCVIDNVKIMVLFLHEESLPPATTSPELTVSRCHKCENHTKQDCQAGASVGHSESHICGSLLMPLWLSSGITYPSQATPTHHKAHPPSTGHIHP